MTFEEYQKIQAINASFLKACSFGHYHGFKYLNEPHYSSDAMEFGTAVHTALLEPEKFKTDYCLVPMDAPKKPTKAQMEAKKPAEKTLAQIAWWNEFNEKNVGRIILDADDQSKINRIVEKCLAIHQVKEALNGFEREKTITFDNDSCKARLDLVDLKNGVVIDVKTTRDASPKEFVKQLLALRYDIQMLHYCRGADATTAYAIAIESESGEVALYDLTDIVFSAYTKKRYMDAYDVALEVQKLTVCPPKFKSEIVNLLLPEWALKESV